MPEPSTASPIDTGGGGVPVVSHAVKMAIKEELASKPIVNDAINYEDEAEKALLTVLESRRATANANATFAANLQHEQQLWDAAVPGERPPLSGIPITNDDALSSMPFGPPPPTQPLAARDQQQMDDVEQQQQRVPMPFITLRDVASRVRARKMQQAKKWRSSKKQDLLQSSLTFLSTDNEGDPGSVGEDPATKQTTIHPANISTPPMGNSSQRKQFIKPSSGGDNSLRGVSIAENKTTDHDDHPQLYLQQRRHHEDTIDVFEGVGGEDIDGGKSKMAAAETDADRLITGAMAIDRLFQEDSNNDEQLSTTTAGETSIDTGIDSVNEDSQLLPHHHSGSNDNRGGGYSALPTRGLQRKKNRNKKFWRRTKKNLRKCFSLLSCKYKKDGVWSILRASTIKKGVTHFLLRPFIFFIVPLLALAAILFYYFDNPNFDFWREITGGSDVKLSWWLIFMARQCITFNLARVTQFILVDIIALRSRLAVNLLGPLITLFAITGKGWPLVCFCWSCWDIIWLRGDAQFQRNWLFWSGIDMFNPANNHGGEILTSSTYLRVLIALLVAGFVTAVKRTYVALFLGKKTFINYKHRLEKILIDILLVSQVAELAGHIKEVADELADVHDDDDMDDNDDGVASHRDSSIPSIQHIVPKQRAQTRWATMKYAEQKRHSSNSSKDRDTDNFFDRIESLDTQSENDVENESLTDEEGDDTNEEDEEDQSDTEEDDDEEKVDVGDENDDGGCNGSSTGQVVKGGSNNDSKVADVTFTEKKQRKNSSRGSQSVFSSASQRTRIYGMKAMLDRWEEPVNKLDKTLDASIHDILQFRKALTFMDDLFCFSRSFGPAGNRDQCIKSAQQTFKKLLLMSPERNKISFDVLAVLASRRDGSVDRTELKKLRRVFRPDRDNQLSMLQFVQSCDTIYKKIRYFRASVGNSSVIDKVLEDMFNILFHFLLFLLICQVIAWNPWTLLLSLSTLLVSFSFALGPSTSKYIEGVLLIALQRPYDLGDRIVINTSNDVGTKGDRVSWFVEDITLFSTTLRYASTNEVATINNASVASSRIINFARSQNALVTMQFAFKVKVHEESVNIFKDAITKFVLDRPRMWVQVIYFRVEDINPNDGFVIYELRVQHRKTWQDTQRVDSDVGELKKFCYEMGNKLNIHWDSCPTKVKVLQPYDTEVAPWQDDDYNNNNNNNSLLPTSEETGGEDDDNDNDNDNGNDSKQQHNDDNFTSSNAGNTTTTSNSNLRFRGRRRHRKNNPSMGEALLESHLMSSTGTSKGEGGALLESLLEKHHYKL